MSIGPKTPKHPKAPSADAPRQGAASNAITATLDKRRGQVAADLGLATKTTAPAAPSAGAPARPGQFVAAQFTSNLDQSVNKLWDAQTPEARAKAVEALRGAWGKYLADPANAKGVAGVVAKGGETAKRYEQVMAGLKDKAIGSAASRASLLGGLGNVTEAASKLRAAPEAQPTVARSAMAAPQAQQPKAAVTLTVPQLADRLTAHIGKNTANIQRNGLTERETQAALRVLSSTAPQMRDARVQVAKALQQVGGHALADKRIADLTSKALNPTLTDQAVYYKHKAVDYLRAKWDSWLGRKKPQATAGIEGEGGTGSGRMRPVGGKQDGIDLARRTTTIPAKGDGAYVNDPRHAKKLREAAHVVGFGQRAAKRADTLLAAQGGVPGSAARANLEADERLRAAAKEVAAAARRKAGIGPSSSANAPRVTAPRPAVSPQAPKVAPEDLLPPKARQAIGALDSWAEKVREKGGLTAQQAQDFNRSYANLRTHAMNPDSVQGKAVIDLIERIQKGRDGGYAVPDATPHGKTYAEALKRMHLPISPVGNRELGRDVGRVADPNGFVKTDVQSQQLIKVWGENYLNRIQGALAVKNGERDLLNGQIAPGLNLPYATREEVFAARSVAMDLIPVLEAYRTAKGPGVQSEIQADMEYAGYGAAKEASLKGLKAQYESLGKGGMLQNFMDRSREAKLNAAFASVMGADKDAPNMTAQDRIAAIDATLAEFDDWRDKRTAVRSRAVRLNESATMRVQELDRALKFYDANEQMIRDARTKAHGLMKDLGKAFARYQSNPDVQRALVQLMREYPDPHAAANELLKRQFDEDRRLPATADPKDVLGRLETAVGLSEATIAAAQAKALRAANLAEEQAVGLRPR